MEFAKKINWGAAMLNFKPLSMQVCKKYSINMDRPHHKNAGVFIE